MALTVGSRLGPYDVTALIGEGGMGQVYQGVAEFGLTFTPAERRRRARFPLRAGRSPG